MLRQLMARRAGIRGTMLRARPLEEKALALRAFEREVLPHLASGRMRPVIDSVVPVRAHRRGLRAHGREGQAGQGARPLLVKSHRLHVVRLLTRLEGRVPAVHALVTRLNERRFDGLAPAWDTIRADVGDSQRMLAAALGALAVTAPARVLDVGTGTGQAAAMLCERYPSAEIDAVDASPAMIERARAKPELSRVRFAVADGGHLPFADGSIDLAVSLLVQPFEHELHRVLAPGGWALFCYPMGPGTPIWFPTALVGPRLRRAGFAEVRSGAVGRGEWTAGRR